MSNRLAQRATLLAGLALAASAAGARACPPSLTVAPPPRGSAAGADGVFLTVQAVHGCHPGPLTVSGTAEGLVGGARRSVTLTLEPGAAADEYVVRRQWPTDGIWVLRLVVAQGGGHATTLVGIDAAGRVTVRQPPRRGSYREFDEADVARLLRTLASG